jgi:AcrR family transcriptional regulator
MQLVVQKQKKPYHHGDLREVLLVAGESALAEIAFENVTLREIARRAGVSHAAPKHHFPTLGDLLAEIAARGFEEFVGLLAAGADRASHQSPETRLAGMGRAYIQFAEARPAIYGLMFGKRDELTVTPRLATAMMNAWDQIEQASAKLVGPARASLAAITVWSSVHGLAMLKLAQRTPPNISMHGLDEHMIRTLIAGLKAEL